MSLRRQMLAQSADGMQLGLSSAEAFGQSEALTTRLKHIIDAYPDGPGILMELIQNADDAGGWDSSCIWRKSVSRQGGRPGQWLHTCICCRLCSFDSQCGPGTCSIKHKRIFASRATLPAGADEVAFLLDEQQYSSNSILGQAQTSSVLPGQPS